MSDKKYIATIDDNGIRIDKVLKDLKITSSRSQIQSWIKEGYVTVDGKQVKSNFKCKTGDIIRWQIPEVKELELIPTNIPLDIVYEDEDIAIINKPKGMVVHPAAGHQTDTLVHALLYHIKDLSSINGTKRPGIVHRLDKDTTGLMVIAKNDFAHISLSEQLMNRSLGRIYVALVHGIIKPESGVIDAPIGRDPIHRKKMAVVPSGKNAKTYFHVLERFHHYTYVQCQLETGRTHQIRVHMKYIKHPIVGDEVYGRKKALGLTSQALHAQTLTLIHPRTKEKMTFTQEVPTYFEETLHQLRKMY